MRIMMISDHADPLAEIGSKEAGGQNIYVHSLSTFLARRGIYVDVYTRWDRNNKREVLKINHHLRVIRIKAGPKEYMPRDNFINVIDEFTNNIIKRVNKEKLDYDLIHSNYWFSGVSGLKIAKKLKIPQFHVFHSIGKSRLEALKNYKEQNPDYTFYAERAKAEKKIANQADLVIATSPVERDLISRYFQVSKKKIRIITIGVDRDHFCPIKRFYTRICRRALRSNKKIILYVGRIEWRKGIATLLFSLKEVLRSNKNIKLWIIGGSKTKNLKQLEINEIERHKSIIEELGLQKNVFYLGPKSQDELPEFYSVARATIVPSYYEPFGIVPLESMACGTPVVASRTGGLKYSVQDQVTGLLASPRDFKDLAEKIDQVLKKSKNFFSDSCQERVEKMFDWQMIIDRYIKVFNELIERRNKNEDCDFSAIRRVRSASKIRRNRVGNI